MSFAIATRAEVLKTKRTASVWLTVLGAGFLPALFLIAYVNNPDGSTAQMRNTPWEKHFMFGWQALSVFLFPMFVILICSLIPQIEYKNNTWKQVFAAPQSVATIFFSKFLIIQLVILMFFVLFNLFMIGSGIIADLIYPRFSFLEHRVPLQRLLQLNLKTYVSILGISALQYMLSLRFKNFIAPIGIGLALLVGSLIAMQLGWSHVYKLPYAHPILTLDFINKTKRPFLENHEWNALGYLLVFLMVGFLDMKLRKEKG
jgi:hypothetical protein